MSYLVYKLHFPRGVHFGDLNGLESTSIALPSDGLFSAIYGDYIKLYNDTKLLELAEQGEFSVSDLLPYKENQLYIPKPYVSVKRDIAQPSSEIDRKKIKSIQFLPVEKLSAYIEFLKTGQGFPDMEHSFGQKQLVTKNQIPNDKTQDNKLYNIEIFQFEKSCGLYFIVKLPQALEEKFTQVMESLGLTGLGGKKNVEIGQFEMLEDPLYLDQGDYEGIASISDGKLCQGLYEEQSHYMLLSTLLPAEEEIEKLKEDENWYRLIKRSGFVNSSQYSQSPQKRKQIYMLASGSVLNHLPQGRIADLNLHGQHPIYRLGKPIMLGVKL